MKAKTKYLIHKRMFLPVGLLIVAICAIPVLVGLLVAWAFLMILCYFGDYAERRNMRLQEKYKVGRYSEGRIKKSDRAKYSDTGAFTRDQRFLAKCVAMDIEMLRESGCCVVGKQGSLIAFLDEDVEHSHLANDACADCAHPIPHLDCGEIDGCSEDEEFFMVGYIDEE